MPLSRFEAVIFLTHKRSFTAWVSLYGRAHTLKTLTILYSASHSSVNPTMHLISHHFGRCLSRHCNLSCTFSITSTWSSTMNVPLTKEALLLTRKMLQQRKWRWSYFLKGTVREKVRPLGWLEGRNVSHKQKDRWRLGSNSLKATERAWDLTRSWTLMSYHSQCPHVETSDPIRTRWKTDLTRTLSSDGSIKTRTRNSEDYKSSEICDWAILHIFKGIKRFGSMNFISNQFVEIIPQQ